MVYGAHLAKAGPVAAARHPKPAVQLYSVRNLCAKALPETLKAIREMGYSGVQCGGFFGRTARELNTLFADHGLAAAGVQMQLAEIQPAKLQQTIDFTRTLGAPYLFVPSMDAKTADEWKRFGAQFAEAAAAFKAAGLKLGYHNHQHEFRDKIDGVCKWELFYANTSRDVYQQIDIGHCVMAGEDPVYWLKRYPHRNPAVHLKAASKTSGVIGEDATHWDAVFAACEADITEWYVVEAEIHPDTLDDVRKCFTFMKQKGRA